MDLHLPALMTDNLAVAELATIEYESLKILQFGDSPFNASEAKFGQGFAPRRKLRSAIKSLPT
jgi:hypothetical protein